MRNGLKFTLNSGRSEDLGGFQENESQQKKTAVEERILALSAEEERRLDREAGQKAKQAKPEILHLLDRLNGPQWKGRKQPPWPAPPPSRHRSSAGTARALGHGYARFLRRWTYSDRTATSYISAPFCRWS